MNGIHDMGGMHGFGRVDADDDATFHDDWEKRAFALMLLGAVSGVSNLDEGRRVIESAPPAEYLALGYYGRWVRALELLLVEKGVLGPEDVDDRLAGRPVRDRPPPELSPPSAGSFREIDAEPRFAVGDRVVVSNDHPAGHTRRPRYVRGRRGVVEIVQPAAVLPDTNAHGLGENPTWLYAVRFAGRELWGDDAEPGTSVTIDLFEPYLEPAKGDDAEP